MPRVIWVYRDETAGDIYRAELSFLPAVAGEGATEDAAVRAVRKAMARLGMAGLPAAHRHEFMDITPRLAELIARARGATKNPGATGPGVGWRMPAAGRIPATGPEAAAV